MPATPLPSCDLNKHFTTDFEPYLTLPGFFPGAGGFFHGHPGGTMRILIFGTDFGPLSYQQTLGTTGGEPASTRTIANLRGILCDAGVPLGDCFLTNLVLCMWRSNSLLGNHRVWQQFSEYVEACAAWHRGFIRRHDPQAVVLMGTPPLLTFGRVLFPGLADHWRGYRSLNAVYAAGREAFQVVDGPKVLLIPHASLWHPNAARSPHVAARAMRHLRAIA